jgi:hypothetical protein
MLKNNKCKWLVVPLLLLANKTALIAQCAMCKSTVESDMANGNTMASGLNTGILYLMAIPYLVLMLGGYFFFKKQIDARVKAFRNRYFPAK